MSSLNLDPRNSDKKYWKSLEELEQSSEFQEAMGREFPEGASELGGSVTRRQFMQVMGASFALAGVAGCKALRRPEMQIMPYNNQPEGLIPGVAQFYASTSIRGDEAVGIVVQSHGGRPTKIEGNKAHPASLGGLDKHSQASILDLYNPERSQEPKKAGKAAEWESFWGEMRPRMEAFRGNGGEGLHFVSGPVISPSFAEVKRHALSVFPKARWTVYSAINADRRTEGLSAFFGQSVNPLYRLDGALRIVSFDCDFLETESFNLAYSRAFAARRNPDLGQAGMNRLYMFESQYSVTGSCADHRLRLKPSAVPRALLALAGELRALGLDIDLPADAVSGIIGDFQVPGLKAEWLKALAEDLLAHRGKSLVCIGKDQPAGAHALGHLVNAALGNVGATLEYRPSQTAAFNASGAAANDGGKVGSRQALAALAQALDAGAVDTLVVLDVNLAFSTPAEAGMEERLKKARHLVHLGPEWDETAALAEWHLPLSHFLEEWNDAIAYDGTASLVQPLIAPLYPTLGKAELLARLSGHAHQNGYEIVKEFWRGRAGGAGAGFAGAGFEKAWRKWLHDGIIGPDFAPLPAPASAAGGSFSPALRASLQSLAAAPAAGIEVLFKEHVNLLDGRFANNAWLQELPEPVTKITWDNAAFLSPALAEKLGVKKEIVDKKDGGTILGKHRKPLVKVTCKGRSLEMPAWVVPGLPDDTVLVHTGYGRRVVGQVGKGTGFNAFSIQPADAPSFAAGSVEAASGSYPIACTQDHWSIENRPLVREATLATYLKQPDFASDENMNAHPPLKSLWKEHDYSQGMQWGMAIDLNACTGCSNCVVACQAENNIPTVGKEQVINGREMHWIRVDRYFAGEVEDPELAFQVMTCQQCENAPCEAVCPVAATVHSREGLNDMVYNRCIGTRYCSNNCPYKVRRFNFFNYTKDYTETEKMRQNPNVTVRFRGVMEKCTYCVQRINSKRIEFKNKGQELIPDGEIIPACAQACPSNAIVFGNLNDPKSKVAALRRHQRDYTLLNDINTRPRTSYLARVRNPNPALPEKAKA